MARQYSDQMSCAACQLVWDMNDPEPPVCPQRPATDQRTTPSFSTPIKVTADDHVYSPEPGVLVTSVHYETDPKTGKRRVIIGFG